MATRTDVRETVVGMLYALEVGNDNILDHTDVMFENKRIRNKQKIFGKKLLKLAMTHKEKADNQINERLNKRTIDDIGAVPKAILRVAVAEMTTDTDDALVISEAIKIASKLCDESSLKLINAVLHNMSKELS
jgi:N utilization substance protein B